jgi:biopolymer transport protein ExbB/TolQ
MAALNCSMCGEFLSPADKGLCPRCREEESRPPSLGASGLHPSLPLALALAVACASLFYGLGPLLLLRDSYVYHLFCGHGWVPYACIFFFFIALWTLLLKLPLLRKQQTAFGLQLLPETIDARIEPGDTRSMLDRIRRLTRQQRSLLLVSRVRQALMRLNQLGTAEKLDDLLRYRAEADESAMESSYAAPKFIIWAIPVLGFVGTVLGISNGVQAFSSLIQNASDLEGLRESLKGVTYGLGQAFETTMIALCMSLLLMLIMSWLQRSEDRLLAAIDDYCMEHLLHKVSVSVAVAPNQELMEVVHALRDLTQQWREMRDAHSGEVPHDEKPIRAPLATTLEVKVPPASR